VNAGQDRAAAQGAAAAGLAAPGIDELPCGLATLAADGTLLRVNPALCALLGRAAESLVGQSFDVLLSAASRMLYQSYLMPKLRLHGQLQEFSLSLLVADGLPVDVLLFANRRSNAQATAYDLLLVPLRQRRRLEDELLQVKRAADESPGMLFQLMCLPDGPAHFPYVSEAVHRLYGCTPMAARDCAEAVFSQLLPEDRATLVRALCGQPALDTAWHGSYQVRGPGGEIAWHAMSAKPRRLASGATLWHGHVADVTAQRAMQAALAERQAAEQASHAKSDFLARVSHELRTPLNGILGFAQLLLTQQADNLRDEQRHRLAVVQRAGQGLLALINEVLDITSIEMGQLSLHLQALPVAGLVDWALQAVEAQALDAGVSLQGPPAPAPDLVLADERRLQQVLLNLLSNAIKYNHRGGRVTLGVSVVGWPADLPGAGADALCLAVTDTGPGLSDEQQRHLFEPFNRLGAERGGTEGTGLGLAISQQLVGLMGGCIRVRSTPGQGSVFQVLLPRAAEALPSPSPPPERDARSTGAPALTRGRVLYVEDNPINVLLMEAIIDQRPGVRLQVAGSVAQGLAAALADPPDLLLLDMQLPDGDGATLLQALRAHPRLQAVPAVAVSAAARADDLLRAREVGFTAYWTKPVVVDDVLAGLDQLLAPGQA
jgi:signal transduction histidine kinase/CheY-like chemotaxis protein